MHLSTQIERTSSPASIVFQFSLARGLGALTAAGVHPRHQTGCQGSNSSFKTLSSPKIILTLHIGFTLPAMRLLKQAGLQS